MLLVHDICNNSAIKCNEAEIFSELPLHQEYVSICFNSLQEEVSPNISCCIYYCGIIQSQSIKSHSLCHLLPAVLIRPYSYLKNDGLLICENKISPSLHMGGKTERQHRTRKENAGGSHLFSESWEHTEHCQLGPGEGSATALDQPKQN